MHTVLHAFSFDTNKPADKATYEALRAELKKGPHKMRSLSVDGPGHYAIGTAHDGATLELETKFLFDNQWNTAPLAGSDKGLRVFDWAEEALFDSHGRERKNLRRGYWLEQTPEMREVRRNTVKCGYCGHQEAAARGSVFCHACIDSEYLKETDLAMTRMRPIDAGAFPDRQELTEAEKAHLLPLWRDAQLHGTTERGKARIAKARRDVEEHYRKVVQHAKIEHDGMVWLMDHGVSTQNVIFYNHTGRFGFGWRKPVGAAVLSGLLDIISEFGFPYDIKCHDGRTLSGN